MAAEHRPKTITVEEYFELERGNSEVHYEYVDGYFEVLSPSTEMKDRTWKMQNYLALPTLEEYILVDSRSVKMEMYRREADKWVYYVSGPSNELELASIDFQFSVREAYADIELEESASEENDEEKYAIL